MPPRTAAPAVAVVATFVAATVIMTWPYVSYRDLGHAQYDGDARLVVWMLAWANHALLDGRPVFQSNLFFPAAETLRHNEHLVGLSLFTLPLTAAGVSAVVAHNVLWWLTFPANGLAAYVFVRQFVRDRVAATLGGLAFAFSFYVMLHAHSHLHLIWMWGLPLSLFLFGRWFDRPTLAGALVWAIVVVLQMLTSWYLAVAAAIATTMQAVVLIATPGLPRVASASTWRRRALFAIAAGAVIVVAVVPYALPYAGLTGAAQAASHSATWDSYLIPPANTVVGRWWVSHIDGRPRWLWGEETLFVGWTVLALATVGVVALVRQGPASARAWVLLLLAGGGVLLSLGPSPGLPGGALLAPYAWLSALPGIEGMRAPARLAVLASLGIAGLAAFGAERLRGGARWQRVLVALAIPVMGLEWFVVGFPAGSPRPFAIPEVYRSPEVRAARAVLSLPMAYGTPEWYQEADYAYFSTAHWRPIVNGFGREAPPGHADLVDLAGHFPASAPRLRALGVQYVVVHVARYARPSDAPAGAALHHAGVRLVRHDDDDYLFELVD